ncbi:hypothetical protein [Acinetobacter higginsii]|uniref:hypothetical protein n=1 Tax=Acinetobacter higginsii TaxID=70347 RepID=UPI001F61D395|nr:hypothetical protein [Acinetobacter higginsii]MCI3879002.1 hypothetical protein [Acinetobacter higginsii]
MNTKFKNLMILILFMAQSTYGKEELTKDEFFMKSELIKLAFSCSELNNIAKNDNNAKRLGVIAMAHGFEISKFTIKELKKDKKVDQFLMDLNTHYKINNDVYAGFLLGKQQNEIENKTNQLVNDLSENNYDKRESVAKQLIIHKQCNLL